MNTKIIFFVLITVILSSCVNRNVRETAIDMGPKVTVLPLPYKERMKIAIARFTNETVYGSGLFGNKSGDRIGKQASDMLARHLTATQRFNVMERLDIKKLKDEAQLMGKTDQQFKKNIKGVDALIIGSIVELGRDTTGGIWLLGKNKTQRVRARVAIRIVNPSTGEVFYSQEGIGEASLSASSTLGFGGTSGFDSTLEGKAIDAAIVNMMNNIVFTLDDHRNN